MKQTTTLLNSLEQLEFDFISNLIAVIWKVIAAVQCFFRSRDHAGQYRQVRATP